MTGAAHDKTNNVELSEAINSMYKWYEASSICYAYLEDVRLVEGIPRTTYHGYSGEVDTDDCEICKTASDMDSAVSCYGVPHIASRWFERGWTLQELLAPSYVLFLARDWAVIGDRSQWVSEIQRLTAIDPDFLLKKIGIRDKRRCPVAAKLAWASKRSTTRPEDLAYCLMGLLDINMPLLYGEGEIKAFRRLQLEFIRHSDDESIFVWEAGGLIGGPLAPDPSAFDTWTATDRRIQCFDHAGARHEYVMTNSGLKFNAPLLQSETLGSFFFPLKCFVLESDDSSLSATRKLRIFLELQKETKPEDGYRRSGIRRLPMCEEGDMDFARSIETFYINTEDYSLEHKSLISPLAPIVLLFVDLSHQQMYVKAYDISSDSFGHCCLKKLVLSANMNISQALLLDISIILASRRVSAHIEVRNESGTLVIDLKPTALNEMERKSVLEKYNEKVTPNFSRSTKLDTGYAKLLFEGGADGHLVAELIPQQPPNAGYYKRSQHPITDELLPASLKSYILKIRYCRPAHRNVCLESNKPNRQ